MPDSCLALGASTIRRGGGGIRGGGGGGFQFN